MKVNGAVQVYALMFESAFKDKQYDMRGRAKGRAWKDLRDTGGRSEWSVKGLADCLRLGKVTVSKAIDALMDQGFISFDGFISTRNGSPKRIYRVTPVDQLEAKRKALEILGTPSLRKTKPPKAGSVFIAAAFMRIPYSTVGGWMRKGRWPEGKKELYYQLQKYVQQPTTK